MDEQYRVLAFRSRSRISFEDAPEIIPDNNLAGIKSQNQRVLRPIENPFLCHTSLQYIPGCRLLCRHAGEHSRIYRNIINNPLTDGYTATASFHVDIDAALVNKYKIIREAAGQCAHKISEVRPLPPHIGGSPVRTRKSSSSGGIPADARCGSGGIYESAAQAGQSGHYS